MDNPVKRCTKCRKPFPATVEYFNRSSRNKDGFYSSCRTCRARFRIDNADRIREQKRAERTRNHEYYEAYEQSDRGKSRISRYYYRNRSKLIAKKIEYQHLNPAVKRRSDATYYKTHKSDCDANTREYYARKFKAPGSYTGDDIDRIYHDQDGCCFWCSCPVDSTYNVDHVIPLSRGGTNWPDNLVIACPKCNRSKNKRLAFIEWTPPNPLRCK